MDTPVLTKVCKSCQEEKWITDFHKGTCKDGLQSFCKDCQRERNRQYRERGSVNYGVRIGGEKACTECGKTKPISQFPGRGRSYDKYCKVCIKVVAENRRKNVLEKTCTKCGETKHPNNFSKHEGMLDGYRSTCKQCDKKENRKRATETAVITCTTCGETKPASNENFQPSSKLSKSGYDATCKVCIKNRSGEWYEKNVNIPRRAVLSHYSISETAQCNCCGESCEKLLTLEHSFNDGKRDRERFTKNGKAKDRIWKEIIDAGFPEDRGYETLCYNCNFGRAKFGECPHKEALPQG